jgi:hypothetical protein
MENGYHPNGSFHGSSHQAPPTNTNGSVNNNHHSMNAMNGSTMNANAVVEAEEASRLDHALLESLFYNEMGMLDFSSPAGSNFISQHFSEASSSAHAHPPPNSNLKQPALAETETETDAKTIAEMEMLQSFGVDSSTMLSSPPPRTTEEAAAWIPAPSPAVASAAAAAAATTVMLPPQSTTSHHHTPIYPAPPAPLHPRAQPIAPLVAASRPPTSAAAAAALNNVILAPKPRPAALSIEPPPAVPVSHERAKQLVEQFATLAARLGIDLPSNVLQSLTSQASKNNDEPYLLQQQEEEGHNYRYDPAVDDDDSPQAQQQVASLKSETEEGSTSPTFEDVAPTIVEELRKTAEEAIAAVTNSKKRSYDDTTAGGEVKGGGGDTNKPLYSKRRKKPRLSDCETRLAELKAENEHLKRHLQNVSNKAYRFDQEKEEAGKRIRRLHDANAGQEEMAKAVQEFSDMYSDYGVNRQQELSFHLEQLQRYVCFFFFGGGHSRRRIPQLT